MQKWLVVAKALILLSFSMATASALRADSVRIPRLGVTVVWKDQTSVSFRPNTYACWNKQEAKIINGLVTHLKEKGVIEFDFQRELPYLDYSFFHGSQRHFDIDDFLRHFSQGKSEAEIAISTFIHDNPKWKYVDMFEKMESLGVNVNTPEEWSRR